MTSAGFQLDDSADKLIELFGEEEIRKALFGKNLTSYQKDPVGFFKNELKIENVYDDLVRLAESVRDNKVTVAKSSNGVGKTFISARIAAWWYLCFPKSQVITLCAPPENNLKTKLWGEIGEMFYGSRNLFKDCKMTTLKVFEANSNSDSCKHFIMGQSIPTSGSPEERKAKFSGSHAPFQLYVLDEGDGIPDEIYEAIDSCMSGDNARMLVMFNPRGKFGAAYNMISDGKANVVTLTAFDHPNVRSGKNVIEGAVSREKTVQRINEWTEPLGEDEDPDENCFRVPDFLIGASAESGAGKEFFPLEPGWRRVTNPAFSYMVLGEYPSQNSNQLISKVWIQNAIVRRKSFVAQYGEKPPEGIDGTFGMDVADEGGDHCCIAKRYGGFVLGFERWRGIDTDLSSKKAARIYVRDEPSQMNIESDGIGAAIPPKMRHSFYYKCPKCEKKYYNDTKMDNCPQCLIDGNGENELQVKYFIVKKVYVSSPSNHKCDFGKFDKLRDELWWAVRDWLEKDPSAMLPPIKELEDELLVAEFSENTQNGKIKVTDKKTMRKRLGRSPDYADSLLMCFLSHFTRPSVRNLL